METEHGDRGIFPADFNPYFGVSVFIQNIPVIQPYQGLVGGCVFSCSGICQSHDNTSDFTGCYVVLLQAVQMEPNQCQATLSADGGHGIFNRFILSVPSNSCKSKSGFKLGQSFYMGKFDAPCQRKAVPGMALFIFRVGHSKFISVYCLSPP